MKNKNTKWIIAGIVVIVIIFAAVIIIDNNTKPTGKVVQAAPEMTVKAKEPIKIGATLALTGSLSYIGQQEYNGMQMAVDEINANGGVNNQKLQLIVEDNKGDPKEAVNTVNKLLQTDNPDIMFSAFTGITQAVKQQIFDSGKIFFYVSTVPTIAQENQYTFRDYFDAYDAGTAITQEVAKEKYNKVKILAEISDQCVQFQRGVEDEALKDNITIIAIEKYQVSQTDLKTNIMKLNLQQDDAVVLCTWRHEQIFMKQLKELNLMKTRTFHIIAPYMPAGDNPKMRGLYEENHAISTWYGFSEQPDTKLQEEFFAEYKEKYGDDPKADAVYAYDDIYVIAQAIEKCPSVSDKECISQKMLETDYHGAGGKLSFDKDRNSQRETILIQVKDGKWVNAR